VSTATATKKLEVLDPTVAPLPAHAVLAPRPETLEGAAIGLLANGKRNADELLELVQEVLADRYRFGRVVQRNKGDSSRPCRKDLLAEVAELSDVVITASGD
jgi:hypothetical protein